jgi:hypothetical protein
MAALSLTGHTDPERFAAEFSGTDLEQANAFVVSLDAARSWFRYHHLFGELLQLELRRTAPEQVSALHIRAAGWLAGHGYPVEAVRHAQAAGDWDLASRLLADHWPGLYLGGQEATVHALVGAFPAGIGSSPGSSTSWCAPPRPDRRRPPVARPATDPRRSACCGTCRPTCRPRRSALGCTYRRAPWKTHMRNLYAKLGAHSRTEAVASARSLDLLAPSASAGPT